MSSRLHEVYTTKTGIFSSSIFSFLTHGWQHLFVTMLNRNWTNSCSDQGNIRLVLKSNNSEEFIFVNNQALSTDLLWRRLETLFPEEVSSCQCFACHICPQNETRCSKKKQSNICLQLRFHICYTANICIGLWFLCFSIVMISQAAIFQKVWTTCMVEPILRTTSHFLFHINFFGRSGPNTDCWTITYDLDAICLLTEIFENLTLWWLPDLMTSRPDDLPTWWLPDLMTWRLDDPANGRLDDLTSWRPDDLTTGRLDVLTTCRLDELTN